MHRSTPQPTFNRNAGQCHLPCTIAKLIPKRHNNIKRGTIPFEWCLILTKRLPAGPMRLIWSPAGRPSKRLQSLLREAQSV